MRAIKNTSQRAQPRRDGATRIQRAEEKRSAGLCNGFTAPSYPFQREQNLGQIELLAADGSIGRVADLHFDTCWALRYLCVDNETLFSLKHFLIPRAAIGELDGREQTLNIELTRQQIENSPAVAPNRPVSRRAEAELHEYYDWRPYWELATAAGGLRSVADLRGAAVDIAGGELGRISDCIIDTRYWMIRYFEVEAGRDMPGQWRLIHPGWIESVDWKRRRIGVRLARAAVETAPAYDPAAAISRRYETALFRHYGRPAYWRSGGN